MGITHHYALLIGYGTAMVGWIIAWRLFPMLWPKQEPETFTHPWGEVGWALLAMLCVLGIGQLYVHGFRLPASGRFGPLLDACNHVVIFSPVFFLLTLRRHALRTAWLPLHRVWARLLVGLGLALIALLAFTLVRTGSDSWLGVVPRVYSPKNFSHLVQVLLEDIAIAILFVRFRSALGLRFTVGLVALLFAATHIPALLASGVAIGECIGLVLDAALAVGVLSVVQRSSDVWWFWCVHFAMDMTQFYAVL